MKRILIFLALLLAAYVSFSQSPIYGRLRVISGLYDNYFQNGTDTFKLGWRTDRFQLKYNTDKRFIDFIKGDSSTTIYNKLILESPNDTMLSVRGNASFVGDAMVSGNFMTAGGYATNNSVSLGGAALGNTSVAIGGEAYGNGSFAGYGSMSSGEISFSIQQGISTGVMSNSAIGGNASGNASIAWGTSCYSNSYALIVFGQANDTILGTNKTTWKLTDPLFQIGNGSSLTARNNAFHVLKNGKTYIADASNTTDAILVVDPTDSTSNFIGKVIIKNSTDTALSVRGGGMNVTDGSVLFSGTTGVTPASGAGTRLMWIPSKAAFRAGEVDGTQWDADSIELYSFAVGYNTKATKQGAFAVGSTSSATGFYSYAFGVNNTASGSYSIANGNFSTASGNNSYSNGYNILASGDFSFASGVQTVANSHNLSVFGQFNDTTISTSEIAWVSTDPLFQIGNGTEESKRNDAFRILKNGKTYIGDSSSTTDAILVVDPTDSTSAFIGNVSITDTTFMEHLTVTDSVTLEDALFDIYNLAPDSDSLIVADDGIINLRTGAYGELRVWVFNAGMYAEYAVVILNVDGSIGIMTENSANVTNVGGTDGNLNIYDAGAYTTIENKLGGSRTIKYVFTH